MPFGLTNALVIFEYMMNNIFQEYLDQFDVIYLDDILIFSSNMEGHPSEVRLVLPKLCDHGLYAKREKCDFGCTLMEFLDYVLSPARIRMDAWKLHKSGSSQHG